MNRKFVLLLSALFLSVLTGFVVDSLNKYAAEKLFSAAKFTAILHQQIDNSDQWLKKLSTLADSENYENVTNYFSNQQDPAGFIFKNDTLLFWSTNQFDIQPSKLQKDAEWHLIQLNNAYGIYKWQYSAHGYGAVSFISIKKNFPYENNYLNNEFNKVFQTDKNITISKDKLSDASHIFDKNNHFLFSLAQKTKSTPNDALRLIGFIAFLIAFIVLFIMYFNSNLLFKSGKLSTLQFWLITAPLGVGLMAMCYFDFPSIFFNNRLFNPQQYAVNQLIKTFTHLTLLCFFLIDAILLYLIRVKKSNKHTILRRAFLYLYIVIFFEVVKGLMLNSNLSFNLLMLRENMFTNIWTQLLIFVLTLGLFCLLHITQSKLLKTNFKKAIGIEAILIMLSGIIYGIIYQQFVSLLLFLMITSIIVDILRTIYFKNSFNFKTFGVYYFILNLVVLVVSYQLNEYKKFNKYKILTENILVNGNSENDPIAELLLDELDHNLREDVKIKQLINVPDSARVMTKYVFNKYLSGFWNKYNVNIKSISNNSGNIDDYNELKYYAKKLKDTGFYSLPASLYDLSFIGLIDIGSSNNAINNFLILEFEPKRNFKSYSFPDLLISNESDVLNQSNISIAKYENEQLIYSDQRFVWPETVPSLTKLQEGFEKIKWNDRSYYVLTRDNLRIVITRIASANRTTLYYYFIFSFLFCLLLGGIFFWIYEVRNQRRNYIIGLTTKFQLVFFSLLFLSFVGILLFSTNYIRNNYKEEQKATIEKKKLYLQKSLQDLYYWTENISTLDAQNLKNNLEELAYRYQTDINIYSNDGKLMGSSQSLIFSKHLLGQLISPEIFFSNESPGNQYEQIGNLSYLAAYTDMINGDYLQIGYISTPQYLSETEMNTKIEQFLLAIIQIYLIVIVFAIILIIIAGKQLADPIHLLQEKLKSMRLGGKNEKVEYKGKDEVGQLVEQYNRTVDELEKSTQLLLQSERETAWRTMARQIAHEINNPLTPMKLTIQQLIRTKQLNQESFDAYFEKSAQTLIEQIDNLSRIAGTFSQFARMPETKFTRVDVAAKLYSVVELFKDNYENIDIQHVGPESNVYVRGDAEQLLQVFNNILKNATQSIENEARGKIVVELLTYDNDSIRINFTDNGIGIPIAVQQDIFKPNFTTKSKGMGLGLSISKNFIEHMGGEISFSSNINAGTVFMILLPEMTSNELLHKEDI